MLVVKICLPQTWVLKNSNYPNTATEPFAAVINGKAYLGNETNMVEFDPVANTYTTKTPPTSCTFCNLAPTFCINNKMYVIDRNPPNYLFEYNPVTDSWIQKNAIPPVYGLPLDPDQAWLVGGSVFSFTIGNKGYIGGFSVVNTTTNVEYFLPNFYEYNPTNDSWIMKANLPSNYNIVNGRTFSINDKGYSIGGIGLMGAAVASAQCYDQTANSWSSVATQMHGSTFPGGFYGGVFVLNNKAYYGMSTFNYYQGDTLIESYDPVQNSWNDAPRVPTDDTIGVGTGFMINGKGYMGLGWTFHSNIPGCVPHYNLYEFSLNTETGENNIHIPELKIFPNPASSKLIIENSIANSQIIISDILGKDIITEEITNNIIQIDISGLEDGMYFIKAITGKGAVIRKFIKE